MFVSINNKKRDACIRYNKTEVSPATQSESYFIFAVDIDWLSRALS